MNATHTGAARTRFAWMATLCLLLLGGCQQKTPPKPTGSLLSPAELAEIAKGETKAEKTASLHFTSTARQSGVDFTFINGAAGNVLMVESTGGGGGWLDFDADGRPDIYFAQGSQPTEPIDSKQPNDGLFRQIGEQRFVSAAALARIEDFRYGQGVCVGDYNDDGFDDIFVTNVGRDTLWRNMGDGAFLDVTEEAGVGDNQWSSSAAFADLDNDGDLDLYVCHYCEYDVFHPVVCRDSMGRRRTCHPKDVKAAHDTCFFNQGDGTFKEEAQQRGLYGPGNKSLGVVAADFDQDGDLDIYVANDTTDNFYFENDGTGHFRELAQRKGCAANRNGVRQASMGLAFGDYDRDGWQDLYSTHFYADSNTLYRNLGGDNGFEDATAFTQLHEPTLAYLGFGSVMQDFDQNGTMELVVANGHIDSEVSEYAMRPQLFTYASPAWEEIDAAGDYFGRKFVGRGVATADYDGDGDLDLLMVHQNAPAELLKNDSQRGAWLTCEFRGRSANRRGIGCRAVVETASSEKHSLELCGGSSYASSMQPLLAFGLGKETGPVKVTVHWPNGKVQTLERIDVNQKVVIEEPDGDGA